MWSWGNRSCSEIGFPLVLALHLLIPDCSTHGWVLIEIMCSPFRKCLFRSLCFFLSLSFCLFLFMTLWVCPPSAIKFASTSTQPYRADFTTGGRLLAAITVTPISHLCLGTSCSCWHSWRFHHILLLFPLIYLWHTHPVTHWLWHTLVVQVFLHILCFFTDLSWDHSE